MLCTSKTGGYYGVRLDSPGRPKPYQARVRRGGRNLGLGYFATAEEAALCIARSPEGRAVAAERAAVAPPLTSEEARQQAQAEGLTLVVTESSTAGYYGVHLAKRGQPKPYQARVQRGGKTASLGSFATAEEAALCVARSPEGRAAAAERAAVAVPPLTSEEARQQAQAEGLTLVVSESSTAGYLCVHLAKPGKLKPFKAQVSRGGKIASLGYFATADEAALYVARAAAKRAASTAPQKKSAKGSTKPCPAMPASRANLKEACPAQLMPPGAFVNEEEMVPPMPPGASRWDGLLLLEERARRACFLLACAGGQEEERSNSRPKRHGSE